MLLDKPQVYSSCTSFAPQFCCTTTTAYIGASKRPSSARRLAGTLPALFAATTPATCSGRQEQFGRIHRKSSLSRGDCFVGCYAGCRVATSSTKSILRRRGNHVVSKKTSIYGVHLTSGERRRPLGPEPGNVWRLFSPPPRRKGMQLSREAGSRGSR